MMERIWELKEIRVNRPCLLNFEYVAGFSALFSTRPKSEEVKIKKTCLSTAADRPGC